MPSKKKMKDTIKLRSAHIIGDAVALGVERGWKKAHKHADEPTADGHKRSPSRGMASTRSPFVTLPKIQPMRACSRFDSAPMISSLR